jgi:uncharacterized protein
VKGSAPLARLLLLLCLVPALLSADVAVPPLEARVTDLTQTLDAGQRQALEAQLAALERDKGSQVAVLIVPTTQPETIEQYSIRVVDRWKLGRKDQDDGVLLIVAKNDRDLRIEVGQGLEGAIPDAVANRIVEETIVPRLHDGDFAGGISAGVARIDALVRGEALPEPMPYRNSGRHTGAPPNAVIFILFALFAIGQFLRALLGALIGGLCVGGLAFGLVLVFLHSLPIAVIAGAISFVFTLVGMRGGGWGTGGGYGGGFGGGSFGGGSFGGGGGFSGGGGGFSGGGASGRW